MGWTNQFLRMVAFLVLAGSFVHCGPEVSEAELEGHYEDSSAHAAARFRGQQQLIPEYAPYKVVLVALPLISQYHREDIILKILAAGAQQVWIAVPLGFLRGPFNPILRNLRHQLGPDFHRRIRLIKHSSHGEVSVWARDWAPMAARALDRRVRFLDFNYMPRRRGDDSSPMAVSSVTGLERVSIPLYSEGGNLMVNSRGECLVSSQIVDANQEIRQTDDEVFDQGVIGRLLVELAGCRRVDIVPRMPQESTGHIDIWAKFLNDDTVAVGELAPELLERYTSALERRQVGKVQAYLDERARQIAELGYRVVRIPMLAPRISRGIRIFRTYLNSLILNRAVLVPRFLPGRVPGDPMLAEEFPVWEKQVASAYQQAGYEVHFLESDDLVRDGGSVHCITMQLPGLAPPEE